MHQEITAAVEVRFSKSSTCALCISYYKGHISFLQMSAKILVDNNLISKALKNEAMDDIRRLLQDAGVSCDMRQNFQRFKNTSSRKKGGAVWR